MRHARNGFGGSGGGEKTRDAEEERGGASGGFAGATALLGGEHAAGSHEYVCLLVVGIEEDLVKSFDGGRQVRGSRETGTGGESGLKIEDSLLGTIRGHPKGQAIERGAVSGRDVHERHRGVDERMDDGAGGFVGGGEDCGGHGHVLTMYGIGSEVSIGF